MVLQAKIWALGVLIATGFCFFFCFQQRVLRNTCTYVLIYIYVPNTNLLFINLYMHTLTCVQTYTHLLETIRSYQYLQTLSVPRVILTFPHSIFTSLLPQWEPSSLNQRITYLLICLIPEYTWKSFKSLPTIDRSKWNPVFVCNSSPYKLAQDCWHIIKHCFRVYNLFFLLFNPLENSTKFIFTLLH